MRPTFGQGTFDGFPAAGQMDVFSRAIEARRRSRAMGFDAATGWERFDGIYRHLQSEMREFAQTVRNHESPQRQLDEMGDVLYVATQLADSQGVSPRAALDHATDKFTARLRTVEAIAAERWPGRPVTTLKKQEWRSLWKTAKSRLDTTV